MDRFGIYGYPDAGLGYEGDWQDQAADLESRMDAVSCEAEEYEHRAWELDSEGDGDPDEIDRLMDAAGKCWREWRRLKDELGDLEGGF